MKKMMIAFTLCLMVGWANASAGLRVFQSTAGADWPRLEAQLTESGKITPEGVIDSGTLAAIAVQTAIEREILQTESEADRQAYGLAFLAYNSIGATIHRDQFRAIGADPDPKKGFRLPDPRSALRIAAVSVVPAASAPNTVIPIAPVLTNTTVEEIEALRQEMAAKQAANDALVVRLTGEARAAAQARGREIAALRTQLTQETAAILAQVTSSGELSAAARAQTKEDLQRLRTQFTNLSDAAFIKHEPWYQGAIATALALSLLALAVALYNAMRTRQKKLVKTINDMVEPLRREQTELRGEVDLVKANLPQQRDVVFPPQFGHLVDAISMNSAEPPQVLPYEVDGVARTIGVVHAEPGYVYINGLPGIRSDEKIRARDLKVSKRWTAVEVKIMRLANAGAFDNLPADFPVHRSA